MPHYCQVEMKLHRWQIILIGSVLIFFGIALFVGGWLFKLDKQISERLEGKRFASPIEFYTAPLRIFSGQTLYKNSFKDSLRRLRYKERSTQRGLRSGEYIFMGNAECQANLSEDLPSDTERCVLIAKHLAVDPDEAEESESSRPDLALIAMGSGDVVYQVYADEPLKPQAYIELNEVEKTLANDWTARGQLNASVEDRVIMGWRMLFWPGFEYKERGSERIRTLKNLDPAFLRRNILLTKSWMMLFKRGCSNAGVKF